MKEDISPEGYIPVIGGRVWYRIVGAGKGIPMLVLHGGPGASSDYLEPIAALSNERPVIFYDQLGSGKSDTPDDPSLWVVERFVHEIVQIREALELQQLHLLGHSWGTIVITKYALTIPVGLVSLILSSPCLSMPRFVRDINELKAKLPSEIIAKIDGYETAESISMKEYRLAGLEFFRRYLCRLDWFLERVRLAIEKDQFFNNQSYLTLNGPYDFHPTGIIQDLDVTGYLGTINTPALFTCGRFDQCTPETTAWHQSLLPGSEMVVFENSAHMAHLEEPELYIQTVRDFLHRIETRMVAS